MLRNDGVARLQDKMENPRSPQLMLPRIIEPEQPCSSLNNFYVSSPTPSENGSTQVEIEREVEENGPPKRKSGGKVTWLEIPPVASEDDMSKRGSRSSINFDRKSFTKRASQIILEVPVSQLKKINRTEGASSLRRETQHFCDTTTLHGPKRIYHGKRWSTWFWVFVSLFSLAFFIYQVVVLVKMFLSTPTVSQVSFIVDEAGLSFPMVTVCNFNPIKKTKIKELNQTGDFPDTLLDYLMQANEDAEVLYWNADRSELHVGDAELSLYQSTHPNFTIEGFYMDAGFECPESLKLCSFGGRAFNCCAYTRPVLTNLGKCWTLDIQSSGKDWLQRQTAAGVNAGLQLIMDSHLEEQFDGTGDDPDPIFANAFENGYRYYIHAENTIPYLVSEGISVSPSTRVYSAITTNKYALLSSEHWGNCTKGWPPNYTTSLPYSSANCASICKATYFNAHCGCSPFTYNIDNAFNVCSPYQTVQCFDQFVRGNSNGNDYFKMPSCSECKIECESTVYHAYNSYGHGFSNGALKWLNKKNANWSVPHVKANFLTINVFFRDMGHTLNTQVQATSLTETLSDIGGNMGMFLGMSVVTVLEISLYLSKVSWIFISKRRRKYLYVKKKTEEEHEKQLEEAVSGFKIFRTRKDGGGSFRNTRRKISALKRHMQESFSGAHAKVAPRTSESSIEDREKKAEEQRNHFMNERKNSLYLSGGGKQESVIQLELDVADLQRNLDGETSHLNIKRIGRRRRSNTAPSGTSQSGFYLWQPPDVESIEHNRERNGNV